MVRVIFSQQQTESRSPNVLSEQRIVNIDPFDFYPDYLNESDDSGLDKWYGLDGYNNDYRAGCFYAIVGRASSRDQSERISNNQNLRFECSLISRDHAIIFYHVGNDKFPRGLYIADLDSKFHTSVNGKILSAKVPHYLQEGDIVSLGSGTVSSSRKPLDIDLKSISFDDLEESSAQGHFDIEDMASPQDISKAVELACDLQSQNDSIASAKELSTCDTNNEGVEFSLGQLDTTISSPEADLCFPGCVEEKLVANIKEDLNCIIPDKFSKLLETKSNLPPSLLDDVSPRRKKSVTFAEEPVICKHSPLSTNLESFPPFLVRESNSDSKQDSVSSTDDKHYKQNLKNSTSGFIENNLDDACSFEEARDRVDSLLPAGWEKRLTSSAGVYFINHDAKLTTNLDPRLKSNEKMGLSGVSIISSESGNEDSEPGPCYVSQSSSVSDSLPIFSDSDSSSGSRSEVNSDINSESSDSDSDSDSDSNSSHDSFSNYGSFSDGEPENIEKSTKDNIQERFDLFLSEDEPLNEQLFSNSNSSHHCIELRSPEVNSEIKTLKINENYFSENSSKVLGLCEPLGSISSDLSASENGEVSKIHSNKRSFEDFQSDSSSSNSQPIENHSDGFANKKAKVGIFVGGILVGTLGTLAALVASYPN
ncbi:hypothetical protein NADFUDRAFT_82781 [Nadsonia fulvescens var. elongata DSM 6958]|uniref:FHA domain-containing protein n=1 Tax=Nadsonia fulvescens var. elongata DSM 6958 TaxID=857566 RepID=A0A1E3PK71_9ASCO|nr:hypothetical protein NADFUDRAFT_82781 [Nadsonia fulvescens var. elongata DSM 6958]